MNRLFLGGRQVVALMALGSLLGCTPEPSEWVLPDPATVVSWYGEETEATIDGNVLEIRGTMDPEFLRRGGRIWARSGPYFYLFNVHVQKLFQDYPDLAGVRATTYSEDGVEIASALLIREQMHEGLWREALARASLAQRDGTENPRMVERFMRFGEDHTEFEYGALAD